jgi:SRSO17 transposase
MHIVHSEFRSEEWRVGETEVSGEAISDGFQRPLGRAGWEADAVRDALRRSILPPLREPDVMLVVDETGFLKKGRHSAGVARPYSGTAGRIDNCQIGVFLAYARPLGHALPDRELSRPKEWTEDQARCRQVGITEDRRFATTPQLARHLLARAFALTARTARVQKMTMENIADSVRGRVGSKVACTAG